MKKKNIQLFLLILIFTAIISILIELTSQTSLYRDPWMFIHFNSSNYILENKSFPSMELLKSESYVIKQSFFGIGGTASYPYPVMLISSLSILSGLNIEFFINHSYFLLLISGLVFFVLFRKLFASSELALMLSVFVIFFPFEPLFHKITVHGWILGKIFGALSLIFLVFIIKDFEEKKAGLFKVILNFFLALYFSFLALLADKSAFLMSLLPVMLFIIAYFFLNKKIHGQKMKFSLWVYAFILIIFLLLIFSSVNLDEATRGIVNRITLFHLKNLHFIPTFISSAIPYSEIYFTYDFSYQIIRYVIPVLIVIILLLFTYKKIIKFISRNTIINSFILSQLFSSALIAAGFLLSLPYLSHRGAAILAWFFILLCGISIATIKNKQAKIIVFLLFFFLVFLMPFYSYTQTLEYKYYRFNERQVSSIHWAGKNTEKDANFYSDIKMSKAIASIAKKNAFNASYEFDDWASFEILPIFYDQNIESALIALKVYPIHYLVLTNDIAELNFWVANQPLKPATGLQKYDESENFLKVFENGYVRIYKINYD